MKISPDKIGTVIGPGGKMIRSIVEETGVQIDIEEDGTVMIASSDGPSADKAISIIQKLTEEAVVYPLIDTNISSLNEEERAAHEVLNRRGVKLPEGLPVLSYDRHKTVAIRWFED